MAKKKVLFVVLPYVVERPSTETRVHSYAAFPYGALSIATYNKGLADFRILDLNFYRDCPDITLELYIREYRPDIIGFTMMFDNSYPLLNQLLDLSWSVDPNAIRILGGAAASYSYKEILKDQPLLDAICYSEGEVPMRSLLTHGNFSDPAWVTKGKLDPPTISYLEDLDQVVDLDYGLVDINGYKMKEAFSPFSDERRSKFFLVTSRGCPFECTYCANAKIHGQKMRFASVDRIIAHVDRMVKEYGMDTLTIYDDQLLIRMGRAKELFRKLAPYKLRIECPNGLSVTFIDEEMAGLMKQAGMDTIYLAVENGSDYVLHKLMRKPINLACVKPAVEALRNNGIFVIGFFVMGMPGETDAHRRETSLFINDVGFDWCFFNPVVPFRGSPLYDECIDKGYIEKTGIGERVIGSYSDRESYFIKVPGIDPGEVFDKIYNMNIELNFHNNYRMKIGDYETAAKCFKEVLKRSQGHKWAQDYLSLCERKMYESDRRVSPGKNKEAEW